MTKPAKEKLLSLIKGGVSVRNLAIRFNVHRRTIGRWCKDYGIEQHINKAERKWSDL